jgi:uncharacterized RDD family membrane protein YckC
VQRNGREDKQEDVVEVQSASPVGEPSVVAGVRRAGCWIRCAAAIIDLILLGIPLAVFVSFLSVAIGISTAFLELRPGEPPREILTRFGPTFLFISLCFFVATGWIYFASFESSRWRATLGKQLFGLYVGDLRGNPVGFWRASGRFASGRLLAHVPVLGSYYFALDCACAGVTPSKRAIHDMLSGCLVLRENTERTFVR